MTPETGGGGGEIRHAMLHLYGGMERGICIREQGHAFVMFAFRNMPAGSLDRALYALDAAIGSPQGLGAS